MDTRREFLRKAILLSGTAGIAGAIPPSVKRALDIDPEQGSTYLDAEHIVILMQENRSFDHCFGSLWGVRGFNDPRAITLPDKNKVWIQTDKAGDSYTPFRFDIHHSKVTWMGSLPHTRSSQVDAFNRGKYDQWLNAKHSGDKKYADMPLTMGYYTREDLPFNYALADAFTICDQNFCSAMTGTWPNRLFFWSGTIRSEKNGNATAFVRNHIPYGSAHWKTFPELLEDNHISWKVYQNDLTAGGGLTGDQRAWLTNFTCNPLEYLSQYNVRFFPRYYQSLQKLADSLPAKILELETKLSTMSPGDEGYGKLQREITTKKEVLQGTKEQLIKWNPDNFDKLSSYQKDLYHKAFVSNEGDPDYRDLIMLKYKDNDIERELLIPKGDILYQFRKDVENGLLPAVSWLVPSQNLSDHPSAPWYGAWFTSEILDILTKNPDVWKKTIFILTYDENDGYFDHIPPYVAPDPEDKETGKCSPGVNVTGVEFIRREQEMAEGWSKSEARTGPIGLGFRVPMIIASPWSRGGKVCSQVFDHTSALQFLEGFLSKKFNKHIKEDNISAWRRTICGDLTAVFSKFDKGPVNAVPFIKRNTFVEGIYNARFTPRPADFKKLSPAEITQINEEPLSSSCLPKQEPGLRVACPLPYELYADGKLSNDKKRFVLKMQAGTEVFGKLSAGSPFKVYIPVIYGQGKNAERSRSWDYAVTPGDILTDDWPIDSFENNKYHVRAYGPDGFYREFMGNVIDPLIEIRCEYERHRLFKNRLTGNVAIKIINLDTAHACHIEIKDNAYKNNPLFKTIPSSEKENRVLGLKKSFGWYDFSIRVKGYPHFMKRYAGHVETGQESYSDPVMS